MIVSAMKGHTVSSISVGASALSFAFSPPSSIPFPDSMQLLQQPSKIVANSARRFPTSPDFQLSLPGNSPGFLTIYAMSEFGSPPIEKNSKPFSSTKSLNIG